MSILKRNLEAMRRWTPADGELIGRAEVPGRYRLVETIDGGMTYCAEGDGGERVEWLGGTSMPRSSAEAIVSSLAVGTGNGLGLSMGTGYEWGAFAGRLGGGQAVFVYEPSVEMARMALEVCDLGEWLESGKIVLFVGEAGEAGERLSEFLREHVGFDVPGVLHPLATIAGELRNGLLARGEAMVRRVVTERHHLVNELAREMEGLLGKMRGEAVAITLTPRYWGERPLQGELGDGIFEMRLDHHGSASMAGRLKALVERRPGKIVGDFFRGQIGCVPGEVVVETWVPPMVGGGYWDRVPSAGEVGARDRIVVHGAAQKGRLMERGIGEGQVEVRLLARATGVRKEREAGVRDRVGMIGDLGVMEMEGLGITLPTHQAVFAAAREIVAGEYLSVHVNMAGDILRRALARAEVAAGKEGAADPALREPMLRIIRDVLIPQLPLATMARELLKEGMALRLVGEWAGFEGMEGVVVEGFSREAGGTHWEDVAVLVVLSPTGMVSPLVVEAAEAGVVVVSPRGVWDEQEGCVGSLLREGEFVRVAGGRLVGVVKGILREGREREVRSQ